VIFWLSIAIPVMSLFMLTYAILTAIQIKTGFQVRRQATLDVAIAVVGTASGILLAVYIDSWISHHEFRLGAVYPAAIFAVFVGILFFLHIAYRQAKEDALALRAIAAESKYHTLEHQMRPHFLFNALNSLAELIESGHERAAEVTHLLSDLYRQILTNSKLKTASVDSEIDIARRYLELEQLRFGSRLHFTIRVAESAKDLFIPSLILQTLVENAVKHGIAKSIDGGTIDVEVSQTADQRYYLQVSNTGAVYKDTGLNGTGLVNTRERLALLYGDRHQFRIHQNGDGKTVAGFYFSGEKLD
jgi:LytS/YehU family sensor histidine kinase